jgi:DNA-binding NtrC family response regulator
VSGRVLIADDDLGARESLSLALEDGFKVELCASGEAALALLEARAYDVVLADVTMPGLGGEGLLSIVKDRWPQTEVLMISGSRDLDLALRCLRAGAYDYLTKPWTVEGLQAVVRRAVEKVHLARENRLLRRGLAEPEDGPLLGASPAIAALREQLAKAAAHDGAVLLLGEPGSGRRLAARALHAQSLRREDRFVAFNAGAPPPEGAAVALFGRGAAPGLVELAAGGTLYLEAVEALPPDAQAGLLELLQRREARRIGSGQAQALDLRVLSASAADLLAKAREGAFREDLYWRLSGVTLSVPPLRERGDDSLLLLGHFLAQAAARERSPVPAVAPAVLEALRAYPFPGNVRELRHLAETLFSLADGAGVGLLSLPFEVLLAGASSGVEPLGLEAALQEFERQFLLRTLRHLDGDRQHAAVQLGLELTALEARLQALGIEG